MRWTNILFVFLVMLLPSLGEADNYPPADHGGADLTLQSDDQIYGVHTNIGTLTIPAGQTAKVLPYSSSTTGSGFVEITAARVTIAGTLDATGAGYPGGDGGGGGGGSAKPSFRLGSATIWLGWRQVTGRPLAIPVRVAQVLAIPFLVATGAMALQVQAAMGAPAASTVRARVEEMGLRAQAAQVEATLALAGTMTLRLIPQ